jgi:hypothetical protein
MEHIFLEMFKISAQYVVGPLAVAWLTAKLNNKPRTKKTSSRKSLR